MRNGWSLKKLHRLILTSDAYRRVSWNNAAAFSKDRRTSSSGAFLVVAWMPRLSAILCSR
jgi:hypothetical protein